MARYSSSDQTVSELIATDSPTRPLVAALFVLYSLLIYAFGAGVWTSAGENHALHVAAAGLVVTLFFPFTCAECLAQ